MAERDEGDAWVLVEFPLDVVEDARPCMHDDILTKGYRTATLAHARRDSLGSVARYRDLELMLRTRARPSQHVAVIPLITFTEVDPVADVEPLITFLATNACPFHRPPRLTPEQARDFVLGGRSEARVG